MTRPRSWDQGLIPVGGSRFDIAAPATHDAGERTLDRGEPSLRNAEDPRPLSAVIANVSGNLVTLKVSGLLTQLLTASGLRPLPIEYRVTHSRDQSS